MFECLRLASGTGLKGDYYEFGLYQGHSFCVAQAAAHTLGISDMCFFGFDSFAGLPTVGGIDSGSPAFHQGDYECSYERVRQHLERFGVDWSRVHLIRGWYDQLPGTAAESSQMMSPALVVLVDCDLYESTVPVLAFIERFLQDGTIVMFDDWNEFDRSDDRGERRAFREFLDRHPKWIATPLLSFGPSGKPHGQAFRLSSG